MYKGFDLSDKVAAITGSTAGMGLAIARGLAQCGAKIVVSSNEKEDTDQAAHALSKEGLQVAGVRCDITDRKGIGQFGAEAKRAFGKVDILFCLALGSTPMGPVNDADLETLDRLLISAVSNNLALAQQIFAGDGGAPLRQHRDDVEHRLGTGEPEPGCVRRRQGRSEWNRPQHCG
jgi:dehydrogenase/reductase SDR family protein 4